jgi:hypothetical protein
MGELGGSLRRLANMTKFGTTTMQYAPERLSVSPERRGRKFPGLPIMPNELKRYSLDLRRGFLLPDRIMYCPASVAEF